MLKNKIALVTGASRGIGKAIALKLAEDGASLIIHYAHNEMAAQETYQEVKRKNVFAFLVRADLSGMAGINHLFKQVNALLGNKKLDILVNNAGILFRKGLDEIQEDQFDGMFHLNVKAPFFVTSKALPIINDGGRIINISSQVSKRPRYAVGAYAMTKAALDNFTLSLANELGKRQITVNSVAPGFIDTDMNREVLRDENSRALVASKAALQRIGSPSDIAHVVSFLASDAGGWITGQCIEASGGAGLF